MENLTQIIEEKILFLKEKKENEIRTKLIELFNNSVGKISDSEIHSLAKKLDIEPNKLEEEIYTLLQNLVKGKNNSIVLKHTDVSDSEYDEDELEMGIKVELEHTDDKDIAKEIAKDHLSEFPDYYTRLKKMEKEAEEYWKNKKK